MASPERLAEVEAHLRLGGEGRWRLLGVTHVLVEVQGVFFKLTRGSRQLAGWASTEDIPLWAVESFVSLLGLPVTDLAAHEWPHARAFMWAIRDRLVRDDTLKEPKP